MSQRQVLRAAVQRKLILRPSTLFEVKHRLGELQGLSPRRRADFISALNTLGRLHRLPGEVGPDAALARMEANVGLIRRHSERAPAALAGLSKSTWQNVLSRVRSACRVTGAVWRVSHMTLTPDTEARFDRLPKLPFRVGLGTFVKWIDLQGKCLDDVRNSDLESFSAWLETSSMRKYPRHLLLTTCRNWNEAAKQFPNFWPQCRLQVETNYADRFTLPWSAFHPDLEQDVLRWKNAVLNPDLTDPSASTAVAPITAENNAKVIRRMASALSLEGRDPQSIRSISDLTELDAAQSILGFLLKRTKARDVKARTSSSVHESARLLLALARHWVRASPDKIDTLKRLVKNTDPNRVKNGSGRSHPGAISPKNRAMLGAFEDKCNVLRFLELPEKIFSRMQKRTHGELNRLDAAKCCAAFAIALLQIAPVRPKNGSGIELGRNLIERGSGANRRIHLHFATQEVKNGVELDFELTGDTLKLLDLYMANIRPLLTGPENKFLFPGRGTSPKCRPWFSKQIGDLLEEEIGIRVTGQQFRHLTGYLFLCENPGCYEVVRQFLGHRDLATTVNFYAGMEMKQAAKTLDAAIAKRRAELASTAPISRRRRLK